MGYGELIFFFNSHIKKVFNITRDLLKMFEKFLIVDCSLYNI